MKMGIDDMIAVLQAAKDGKTIQFRIGSNWSDLLVPSWDFGDYEYRVKPEPPTPREFWVNMHGGMPCTSLSKELADRYADNRDECIHVREVLDENKES